MSKVLNYIDKNILIKFKLHTWTYYIDDELMFKSIKNLIV